MAELVTWADRVVPPAVPGVVLVHPATASPARTTNAISGVGWFTTLLLGPDGTVLRGWGILLLHFVCQLVGYLLLDGLIIRDGLLICLPHLRYGALQSVDGGDDAC
ncbi:MAG TPA: hypothetical protein VEO01_42495 [Pseudonocardiaceae bacterium]|nr:hypothetical protein [Pseudonocardiaceae bacterium]